MPTTRDEVGLVRAIAVKARIYKIAILQQTQNHILQQRSSSKRKEMFKTIQAEAGVSRSKQLILDMKVRWSSTYLMIHRAESNKKVRPLACLLLAMTHVIYSTLIHLFTQWLLEETDMEKHDKILSLKLKPSEWERAGLFLGLLAVCILCSISLKLMFSHFRTARR